ncbi:UNVERIFIED_CONTAM: hypothetical protein Sradi_2645400 [Sesamum radiatum]|uniref:Uncharacterized protein n=1 Tax=Sesamum radiatum TaxID=300843 RepID=A0AAW2S548_SESRA
MILGPNGITIEKGNILKVGQVLLKIYDFVILRHIGLLKIKREFVLQDLFIERGAVLLPEGDPEDVPLQV